MSISYNTYREKLILAALKKLGGKATVNEVIDYIWLKDKYELCVTARGWRFYVHLNKFPAPMQKKGLIKFTGKYKKGKTGLREKIWKLTK